MSFFFRVRVTGIQHIQQTHETASVMKAHVKHHNKEVLSLVTNDQKLWFMFKFIHLLLNLRNKNII